MAERPVRTPGTDDWTFTWEIWVSPADRMEPRPAGYVAESIQHAAPVIPSKTSDARAPRQSLQPGDVYWHEDQPVNPPARCGAAAPRSTAVCRRQPGHTGGHHADPNIRWPRASECDHRFIAHHSPTTPGTTPGWRCEACGTGITPASFANSSMPGITWTEGTPTSRYERTTGKWDGWDYREVVEPADRPYTQLERADVLAPVVAIVEAELRRNVRQGYDDVVADMLNLHAQLPSAAGLQPTTMTEVLMREAERDLAARERAIETATFGGQELLGEFPAPACVAGQPCDKCFAVECAGGCGKCDHDPLNAGGFKSTTTVEEID